MTPTENVTLDALYAEVIGIKQALIGNHLTQDGGLIARVNELEKEVEEQNKDFDTLKNDYKSNLKLITVIGSILFGLPNIISAVSALLKLFGK